MSAQPPDEYPGLGTNGTSAPARIQIPGLFINDEQVDGEIYVQWTPSANSTRAQTSTVFIVAGPNAPRPGLHPHDSSSKPDAQELTELQAEAFTPTEKGVTTEASSTGAAKKVSSAKQNKKPGPKSGYAGWDPAALATVGYNDVSPPAAKPKKRRKAADKKVESGDDSTVRPALSGVPKLGSTPTLTAAPSSVPVFNHDNSRLASDKKNGVDQTHEEVSVEAVTKGSAMRYAKPSFKELAVTNQSDKAIPEKHMSTPEKQKVTVDGMGRKRVRDPSGYYAIN